ncbi:transcriptional regulator [Cupriavidus gilardii]|uniref:Helix-turn-helix domain-containing protein n=1 Tax=Cupriavidus gilardii TaxID=82541 RepID=A0A849BJX4_9BURK|nr:helix-turn-helix domain-containing protein [Cupriavidus gilardii]KAB0592771.1 helix-turn-helix domain-containing protein [Cupriavidus gilardii]NNH14318.1 helix-turn-helix domain-containing protein [Cupriavidus gilardii]USE78864.1 helix-turn-helix domain-containing protein [Cupriavidus gilardii]
MKEHPIDMAARIVGSQVALAVHLSVTKAAVNQWKQPGRKVPAEHCPAIERLTGGLVRCELLRPDVDWAYLRDAAHDGQPAAA